MTHTPTPWKFRVYTSPWGHRTLNVISEEETVIATVHWQGNDADANAERIVACVNACDGLSNEVLNSKHKKYDAFFEAMELQTQRDELRDTLGTLFDSMQAVDGNRAFKEAELRQAIGTWIAILKMTKILSHE